MKTITNKSNFVIVVTNGFISKEIPIHGQEIIQDDETNLPEVANPGAGKTTVVLYVPEDTPKGCYAVGSFNWHERNTEKMFAAVETATNPRWVACTFD